MNTFRKIAVIGSNSFSGSHFVQHILDNTDAEILGINRPPESAPLFLPYLHQKIRPSRFQFFAFDLNKDLSQMLEFFDSEKPDAIVNFAAQAEVRSSWNWPEHWFQTNCMAIVKLANHLKDKSYLKRYVHVSTPEVYGTTEPNMKETFHFNPSTPYAASRLAGEAFLHTLAKRYQFPLAVTRAANVYGPHQQLYRIIPKTILSLKHGKKIQLHGAGVISRSFIHIRDVVDATLRIACQSQVGEVFHISRNGEEVRMRDVVKLICDSMGYDFEKVTESTGDNFGQDMRYSLCSSKAREKLSWEPKTSLLDGIGEVIGWVDENWKALSQLPMEYTHRQ